MGTARIGSRVPPEVEDPTPSNLRLQDWEQIRGEVTAIEPTPMGLLITVRPVAADVSFYMRDTDVAAAVVVGANIEALKTPAGVRVRRVDRVTRRASTQRR